MEKKMNQIVEKCQLSEEGDSECRECRVPYAFYLPVKRRKYTFNELGKYTYLHVNPRSTTYRVMTSEYIEFIRT